jgi:hypothetical protein
LNDGDNWSIDAEWPDGTIERVDTFKAHFEAVNWLSSESHTWLAGRVHQEAAI